MAKWIHRIREAQLHQAARCANDAERALRSAERTRADAEEESGRRQASWSAVTSAVTGFDSGLVTLWAQAVIDGDTLASETTRAWSEQMGARDRTRRDWHASRMRRDRAESDKDHAQRRVTLHTEELRMAERDDRLGFKRPQR